MREIREPDRKVLRELHPVALDRFCRRVLSEVVRLAADADKGAHERYLEVFGLLRQRDEELASAFDDSRRSTAFLKLLHLRSHGLLSEEEFARFTPGAREAVQALLGPWTT